MFALVLVVGNCLRKKIKVGWFGVALSYGRSSHQSSRDVMVFAAVVVTVAVLMVKNQFCPDS